MNSVFIQLLISYTFFHAKCCTGGKQKRDIMLSTDVEASRLVEVHHKNNGMKHTRTYVAVQDEEVPKPEIQDDSQDISMGMASGQFNDEPHDESTGFRKRVCLSRFENAKTLKCVTRVSMIISSNSRIEPLSYSLPCFSENLGKQTQCVQVAMAI